MPCPLTTIFENRGNVTSYFVVQNVLISVSVPGSCWPNSLAGKARTSKPAALVLAVERLEPLVLRGVAAVARGVDDQEHVALVGREVDVLAVDVLDGEVEHSGPGLLGNGRGGGQQQGRQGGRDQNGDMRGVLRRGIGAGLGPGGERIYVGAMSGRNQGRGTATAL